MRELAREYLTTEEIAYYTSLGINLDSDILDPQVDLVFKAIFTSNSDESRGALINFLGYAIGRSVKSFRMKENELAVTGLSEKQSAFDIHVTFNDGDEADIEMQVKIKDDLPSRVEYYTGKLNGSQAIKGHAYADLKKIYTIVVLGNTLFKDTTNFYDEYQYRNKNGRPLTGNTHIIFIELSKLGELLKKPVSAMTGLEKWAVFLRHANHSDMKDLIAQIKESEDGVRMGADVLDTISTDRNTFLTYFYRLKHEADQESQLIYAKRQGVAEGEKKGEKKVLDLMREGYSASEIEKILAESASNNEDGSTTAEPVSNDNADIDNSSVSVNAEANP